MATPRTRAPRAQAPHIPARAIAKAWGPTIAIMAGVLGIVVIVSKGMDGWKQGVTRDNSLDAVVAQVPLLIARVAKLEADAPALTARLDTARTLNQREQADIRGAVQSVQRAQQESSAQDAQTSTELARMNATLQGILARQGEQGEMIRDLSRRTPDRSGYLPPTRPGDGEHPAIWRLPLRNPRA